MNAFGKYLHDWRIQHSLSHEEIAARSGIPLQRVKSFEYQGNELPGETVLPRLAAATGIDETQLRMLVQQVKKKMRQQPLARFIRTRRKAVGLRPDDCAQLLGIDNRHYYGFESGHVVRIPAKLREPLAEILRCSPDDIRSLEPPKKIRRWNISPMYRHHRETTPESSLGAFIRYHRKKQGLSQKGLAEKLGLRQGCISYVEAHDRPSFVRKTGPERLARILRCPLSDIASFLPPLPSPPPQPPPPPDYLPGQPTPWRLGRDVRRQRKARDLTIRKAAMAAGIGNTTWGLIETSPSRPRFSAATLERVLAFLGMDPAPYRSCIAPAKGRLVLCHPTYRDGSPQAWELGRIIRTKRRKRRLSIRQLAEIAGVSRPFIDRLEISPTRERVDRTKLARVLTALGLETEALIQKHLPTKQAAHQGSSRRSRTKRPRHMPTPLGCEVLGAHIAERRVELRLSAGEIAEAINKNDAYVTLLEKGLIPNPDPDMLQHLAECLAEVPEVLTYLLESV